MSLYEAAKDAVKIAQKADNVELLQKLLDVQQQALVMQEKQNELNQRIHAQQKEIEMLRESKKFVLADGKKYLIDPEYPDRQLCPICTKKLGYEVPMYDELYCSVCKTTFD